MTFTWEQAAASGDPMPDGMMLAEQRAFQAVAMLYARFRSGLIDREAATQEKKKIKAALELELQNENFQDNTALVREKLLRLTEQAVNRMRTRRTVEDGLYLCDVIDGIQKTEYPRNVMISQYGANCPACNGFFDREHAAREPRFCERCGAMLFWRSDQEGDIP